MISLKQLEAIETSERLEELAEELAGKAIQATRDDLNEVYGENAASQGPEHVYGLAGVKESWHETLLIGRWIAEAKQEILQKLEDLAKKSDENL
jgi:hypothetical protein